MPTKHQKLWKKCREDWVKLNPPNHEGYYVCYLCHKWVHETELTLDHIIPRSRAPHLRYVHENLAPCCWECNTEKGSKVYKQNDNRGEVDKIPW